MFIEFETGSGRTLLNVRHIVQVKRFQDLSDAITEIILANGGVVTVAWLRTENGNGVRRVNSLSTAVVLNPLMLLNDSS